MTNGGKYTSHMDPMGMLLMRFTNPDKSQAFPRFGVWKLRVFPPEDFRGAQAGWSPSFSEICP